jgi:hypothetical protein
MSLGEWGLLLQGVGSVLLAAVTAVVGLRAARALTIRVEGPIGLEPVERPKSPRRR